MILLARQWMIQDVGTPVGFTISNFKITYPAKTESKNDFVVAIDANSKIKTANVALSLASRQQKPSVGSL